jgi:hypothetical protein
LRPFSGSGNAWWQQIQRDGEDEIHREHLLAAFLSFACTAELLLWGWGRRFGWFAVTSARVLLRVALQLTALRAGLLVTRDACMLRGTGALPDVATILTPLHTLRLRGHRDRAQHREHGGQCDHTLANEPRSHVGPPCALFVNGACSRRLYT